MNTIPETNPTTENQLGPGLRWGIKASFVDYVRRMPDGKGSVGNGAVPIGAGDLFYSYDAEASTTRDDGRQIWAFRGDVRFSGHFGMLFVRIAHPRIEVDSAWSVLTIEDPEGREDAPRVPLVTARPRQVPGKDGVVVWVADEVALTAEGVALFNEVYAEGEPFEPLVVQLPA